MARARVARKALKERKTRLEQMGVRFLSRRAKAMPPVENIDPLHVLNADERAALRSLQRGAILRAFAIGAAVGTIVALTMLLMADFRSSGAWSDTVIYWSVVAAVGVTAAVGEVAFMYWDSLRTVHRLAHIVGVDVYMTDDGEQQDDDARERAAVASALARAALELPNPPERLYGVDPQRELSRVRIIIVTMIYKAKISLTNFMIKAVIRRTLGRAGLRTSLSFVGVPVTALWNCAVSWQVMRQARLRVMGPSAAIEYVALVLDREPPLGKRGRVAALRAVGCTIVSTKDMHPNLRALLMHLHKRLAEPVADGFDERALFLDSLGRLDRTEQGLVLRLLCVAAVIDGKVGLRERGLVREALAVCGRPTDLTPLRALRRALVAGDPAPLDVIRSIGA